MPTTSSSMLVKPGGHIFRSRPGTFRWHSSAGSRFHQDGAIMFVNGVLGILTGGAMVALATNSFQSEATAVMGPGSTAGILILLGSGLVGLGIRGRKKIFQGTPIDGRYLAWGMKEVNFREGTPVSANKRKRGRT